MPTISFCLNGVFSKATMMHFSLW